VACGSANKGMNADENADAFSPVMPGVELVEKVFF
jgi:hypothetical protein